MKTQQEIIKNAMSSLYIKTVAMEKGWDKKKTEKILLEYVGCKKAVSLYDYLMAQ